jgi:hypothetical protein
MLTSPHRNLFVTMLATAALSSLLAAPRPAGAGEGGVTHVVPGATATLSDLPGTSPAWFVKPMYLNYQASQSATIPTAAGLTSNIDATADTFAVAVGRTFGKTVLGGAHYTFALALPYVWQDISANVQTPKGPVARKNKVDGFGDLAVMPVMLTWKSGSWQYDATLAVYAPTGNYEKGRLGNTGLNYWTFDPVVGAVYSTKKGFNAMLHAGYAMNTENPDTNYHSGSMFHAEGVVQQFLPVGKGLLNLGAEGFYFDQVTCDGGDGATLGCFEGLTAGLGPVLGYILPMDQRTLIVEFKWLPELDVKKRVEGDYLWAKMIYKF